MENSYFSRLFNLKDKVILVTGATGQLGFEICQAYQQAGAVVIGVDKVLNPLRQVHKDQCEYYELDITQQQSIKIILENIVEKQGRLDVLINNAGVSCFEPFETRPEASFDWVMDVNLKGTFLCIQAYVNLLKENQLKGCIVNIASMYGVISPDFRIYTDCDRKNSEVYGATKAGIIQMTRYFATHLAQDGIRVNSISPGGIYNPDAPQGADFMKNYAFRCPLGRMAQASEMIGGILYLSSDAASYTTGQNLLIDGGMSCW